MRPVSLCLGAEDQAVQPMPAPRPLPPPSSGVSGGSGPWRDRLRVQPALPLFHPYLHHLHLCPHLQMRGAGKDALKMKDALK